MNYVYITLIIASVLIVLWMKPVTVSTVDIITVQVNSCVIEINDMPEISYETH